MNPPKILINSAGNLREIPKESTWKISLNFRADSRFTYNPNFPWIPLHHVPAIPGDSPQNPRDFARYQQAIITGRKLGAGGDLSHWCG